MRVLVCGGRTFDEWRTVSAALTGQCPTVIIQGGAAGADQLARKWADVNRVPCVTYAPNWSMGKKAGPMRNQFMLEDSRPDLVIAFPGGRGTEDMVERAKGAGVDVWRPKFMEPQASKPASVSGSNVKGPPATP